MNTNRSIKGIPYLDNRELVDRVFSEIRGMHFSHEKSEYMKNVKKEILIRLNGLHIQAKGELTITTTGTNTLTSTDLLEEDYEVMLNEVSKVNHMIPKRIHGVGVSERVYNMLQCLPAGNGKSYMGSFSIEFNCMGTVYTGIQVAIDKRLNGNIADKEYKMIYDFQDWLDYLKELEIIDKDTK